MSYILEALKKAERQRRLGQAPDIYAPSIADAIPAGGRAKSHRRRWTFAAGLLLAVAALLWFVLWNESPRPVPVAASVPAASHAAQDIPPPADRLAQAAPEAALPAPHAASSESAVRKPAEQAHASEKAPAVRENERHKRVHATPKPAAKPKKSKQADAAHAGRADDAHHASASAASTEDEHLPSQHELPDNIRQQIPAMAVNGYIYANNPADRSIVINNRVLHEGEQLMPGLKLEKMKPKEAVMNYKGFRYRLLY